MQDMGFEALRASALQRINVVGCSGSGKSTFARRLAERLEVPYIEMDEVFWEPHWTEPSDEVFFARLARALEPERWVLDGNYSRTTPLKWARAQTIIWLDYSLARTLWRSFRRTLVRSLTRRELWAGNRESLGRMFSRDSVLLFAYRAHGKMRLRYEAIMRDPAFAQLSFVRVRSPSQAEQLLHAIAEAARADFAVARARVG